MPLLSIGSCPSLFGEMEVESESSLEKLSVFYLTHSPLIDISVTSKLIDTTGGGNLPYTINIATFTTLICIWSLPKAKKVFIGCLLLKMCETFLVPAQLNL